MERYCILLYCILLHCVVLFVKMLVHCDCTVNTRKTCQILFSEMTPDSVSLLLFDFAGQKADWSSLYILTVLLCQLIARVAEK